MTDYPAVRDPNRCPSHPGGVLQDMLSDMDVNKSELASNLGISRQQFYDILRQRKPVSPTIAAKLGKMFGGGPGLWLRLQASYDAWHAEREVDTSKIKTLTMV